MKQRVKIDSSILSFVIILTGILYQFPQIYSSSRALDNFMDFIGFLSILKGVLFRMSARAHKKRHSNQGSGLVVSGLYRYTRNPMYLGSFQLGFGFVLIVWPWWTLPLFAGLFYLRFRKQVVKEEAHLTKLFGDDYRLYCKKTPRVFPKIKSLLKMNFKKIFPIKEMVETKEVRGFIAWPALAIALETLQERIIFGTFEPAVTLKLFVWAVAVFFAGLCFQYARSS